MITATWQNSTHLCPHSTRKYINTIIPYEIYRSRYYTPTHRVLSLQAQKSNRYTYTRCQVITLVYHRSSSHIASEALYHTYYTLISMIISTVTCTTYLWVTLSVVLFRWHSSVYLASPYHTLFARFRTLLIQLPFSNPFLFWLCLILLTFIANRSVLLAPFSLKRSRRKSTISRLDTRTGQYPYTS